MAERIGSALWAYLIGILVIVLGMISLVWIFESSLPAPAQGTSVRATIVMESVKAALQLAVIGVIGGLAKFLFDRLQADRLRHEAALEVQKSLLHRLRVAQEQVNRARASLRADQDADNYREQVRELMDVHSALSALSLDLLAADNAMGGRGRIAADELQAPQSYLDAIIQEWTREYHVVQHMKQHKRDSKDIADHLQNYCPKVRELCEGSRGDDYARFVVSIESAARLLLRGLLKETA